MRLFGGYLTAPTHHPFESYRHLAHGAKAICMILKYLCMKQFHGMEFSINDIKKFHIWVDFGFQSLNLQFS